MGDVAAAITIEIERGVPDVGASSQSASAPGVRVRESVVRILSFCVLMLALASIMSAAVNSGLRKVQTSSYGAWNRVMQGKVNADIVISGSSRAAYHYDPRVVEAATGLSAYNIGRAGTQTDVQLAVLKAYLEHNRKPAMIVHNLDAFSFVASREIFDPALYIPYLKDREIYEALSEIDPGIYKSRYMPLYGYVVDDMNLSWLTGLKALAGINPKEDYILGFSPQNKSWTDDFNKYKASHPDGVRFSVEPAGVRDLTALAELCHARGIRLIFVYSPEFAEMQKLTKNRVEIFAQLHTIAKQYDVPLLDYSTWEHNGDFNLFYNSQHLNARGASLFSQDFSKRLEQYVAAEHLTPSDPQRTAQAIQLERSSR